MRPGPGRSTRKIWAGPEMSEEEYKTHMEGLRAMLVEEWTSLGDTPEAVDAMLAAEGRKHAVVPSSCAGVTRADIRSSESLPVAVGWAGKAPLLEDKTAYRVTGSGALLQWQHDLILVS